jgi:hypothetical protein
VRLTVYNLLGQEVIHLVDEVKEPGRYTAFWNRVNASEGAVASGVYLYRLISSDGFQDTKRVTLLR